MYNVGGFTLPFFTFGLLGIGWLIDLFLIPGMAREANQRFRPGQFDYNIAWLLCFPLGLGVRGLWMGLSTGLIVCGVVLTWYWHRRISHYTSTGRLR